ncbi:MAG: hypothetical protein HQL11_02490, partial [Candidatus Omnitrophica bacterium]|nr:hypothetical protein [Candidatus Omnitrophota bacterium]
AEAYSALKEAEKASLLGDGFGFNTLRVPEERYAREAESFTDEIEELGYYDLTMCIGNDHVYREDQMTMGFSLEERFPFLDHRLVEAGFRIPSKFKVQGRIQKYVLKKVAAKYMDPRTLTMKKKGFILPMRHWFRGALKGVIDRELADLSRRSWLRPGSVEDLRRRYGQTDECRIWSLVSLEKWFKMFMDSSAYPWIRHSSV